MALKDGLILKLGKESELSKAEESVDGKGRFILPGAIDAHVHLRDQRLSYKETFETGTAAAVAGGVTTVLDMPNNDPPTNTERNLRERMRLAEGRIYSNVGFYAAPNQDASESRKLLQAGAFGLKVNMLKPIGGRLSDSELRESMNVVKAERKVTVFHAEDGLKIHALQSMLKGEGKETYEDFLTAHPPSSEVSATNSAIAMTKGTKCRGHIAHISSEDALMRTLSAKKAGIRVTSEVTPHHLFLDSGKLSELDGLGIMTPPLRTQRDSSALRKALANGMIDICASDHAPHTRQEKTSEDVWDVSPGVSGLDIFMPLLLSNVSLGEIGLNRVVEATSGKPAEIFGLSKRGALEPSFRADFIIVNLKDKKRVKGDTFKSRAKFSPFEGRLLNASVVATYVKGECVMSEGEIVGQPAGSVLRSLRDGVKIST